MAVDQVELIYMEGHSASDLTTLNSQVSSTLDNITKLYADHLLYWAMLAESKNYLEWWLVNVKVPDKLNHWAPGVTFNLDDIILPTVLNNYCYVANPAGATGATEPIWPTTYGATVVDGAVTWTCNYYSWPVYYGPTYGVGNISDWQVRYNNGASPGVIYSPSVAWDNDVKLTQWMGDYAAIYPMVYGTPFGTIAMLAALTTAYSTLLQRRNEVAARNNVLVHYETYVISVYKTGTGSITPAGPVTLEWGTNQTFTFSGTVVDVVVDAISQGILPNYTFSNVSGNHSIRVDFT